MNAPVASEARDRLAHLIELRSQISQALEHLLGQATPCAVALGLAGVGGQLHHAVTELQALCEDLGARIAEMAADRGLG